MNLVNRNAGIGPVKVDREVFDLVKRSIKISSLTDGAFDITYGSVDKRLWNFDRTMNALPDEATAKQMVRLINYRNIVLDKEAGDFLLNRYKVRGLCMAYDLHYEAPCEVAGC